jgi:hypothetical protein
LFKHAVARPLHDVAAVVPRRLIVGDSGRRSGGISQQFGSNPVRHRFRFNADCRYRHSLGINGQDLVRQDHHLGRFGLKVPSFEKGGDV